MKRIIVSFIIICMSTQLCGCMGISPSHPKVEKLLVMQVMGYDEQADGVLVSLSSAAENGEGGETSPPIRLSGTGASISSTVERLHAHSTGKDLFCAHTTHVLIGEEAARSSVEPVILYICRSPDMRLGVPIFVVKGETAETAVKCAGDDKAGIAELISSAHDNLDERGGGQIFPAAEILRNIERYGGSLASAIECTPKEKGGKAQDGCSVDFSGYAVLKGWQVCDFIPRSDAVGVDFLKNEVDVFDISAQGPNGTVTLEISSGSTSVLPVWDSEGKLTGLNIYATVTGAQVEGSGCSSDQLAALLEKTVSERIGAVLLLSRKLGVDFLGLAGKVESEAPYKFRKMEQSFPQLLPTLQFRVSVSGTISHTNDIEGA